MIHFLTIFLSLTLVLTSGRLFAQGEKKPISEEMTGHIFKPVKVNPSQENINKLQLAEGFKIDKYMEGLGKPRMITFGPGGAVYISRRDPGDVLLLNDNNKDGKADGFQTIFKKKGAHGIAVYNNKLYIVTVKEVYSADIKNDGTIGEAKQIMKDLPDGGQHANRTIAFGPDNMMYITVGSTCNACKETSKESATIIRANPDGTGRKIYAKGLRNTIGFDWHPVTKELYGMDHGIDWLGDDEQKEELNLIRENADYGWPYIYSDGKFNKADEPDSLTWEQYAAKTEKPLMLLTAHSAPMGMVFNRSNIFPSEYQNDAFVTLHGSWNAKPAVGYKVVRIDFENGKPVKSEDFISGFLAEDGQSQFGRVVGIAQHADGSFYITDDDNGVVYRVSYAGKAEVKK